jgi:uncharacterized protein
MRISQLFIYPVKSLSGIAKQSVEITNTGFKHHRRWMLVDEKIKVTVWDDVCDAVEVNQLLTKWFSKMLHINCKLVYMAGDTKNWLIKDMLPMMR